MSTEERVRQAAVELFATRGFHGTGIRDLASAAGLSSATLYHYMGTKEELLVALMRRSLEALIEAAEALRAEGLDPVDHLAALVGMHVRAHAVRRLETRVVDDEMRALTGPGRAEVVALRDRYEQLWGEAIDAGVRAGAVRVADAAVARRALLEMCSSVSRWYAPSGPLSVHEVAEHFTGLALGLLGAPRAPRDSPAPS